MCQPFIDNVRPLLGMTSGVFEVVGPIRLRGERDRGGGGGGYYCSGTFCCYCMPGGKSVEFRVMSKSLSVEFRVMSKRLSVEFRVMSKRLSDVLCGRRIF